MPAGVHVWVGLCDQYGNMQVGSFFGGEAF
jgi:hypothetical protein